MNETQTRHDLIDPALKAAGWNVVEGSRILTERPITQGRILGGGKRTQPLKADYVLTYRNVKMAVIEAKADKYYYTEGLPQAKDYAERLDVRFTYATNGKRIYGVDMETGEEGDVDRYPTPDELWEMTFPSPVQAFAKDIDAWRERFRAIPFEDRGGTWQPRYYQDVAICRTLDAIAAKKDRLLLTLATGTGKTAVAFQIAWALFQAKWNLQRDGQRRPRILFLADRNILADQAFNAFGAFDDDALVRITPADIRKKGKVPTNGAVFFTIFQSFMAGSGADAGAEEEDEEQGQTNSAPYASPAPATPPQLSGMLANDPPPAMKAYRREDQGYFGDYPPDFFDFIIIDECHRGGANDESSWRTIMDYFEPSVQLGLTATPKRDVNGDTYAYFGEPLYTYSLASGVDDGFLTPFRLARVKSTLDDYQYSPDDIIVSGQIDENRRYEEKDFNREINIPAREKFRVDKFMGMIDQSQKSLVFCRIQDHAAQVRDYINQVADSNNPFYCQRVTADDGGRGEKALRNFQNDEKTIPTILTTSRKLSTGVDAPEVRNIILMRPVTNMIEFKQIVGRGTRLFDGKDYFTIYDFVGAYEHFNDPEWDGTPEEPPPPRGPYETGGDTGEDHPEPDPETCDLCGYDPCQCGEAPDRMIEIRLSDGRARRIDSMVETSFYSPGGQIISAREFLEQLYGELPEIFKSEADLRRVWAQPATRRELLNELQDRGYAEEQLRNLRKLVGGDNTDLFDVLAHVAFTKEMVPRQDRASRALERMGAYNPKRQEFLRFVLDQYVKGGVKELDDSRLRPLLELRYQALANAKRELGSTADIREAFIGLQGDLYID
ncbi:MAG: EcoAI/FtnUII family type I restriction enzme subunit R [Lewinella sp.]